MPHKDLSERRAYLAEYFESRKADQSPRACRCCGAMKSVDQFSMLKANPGIYCLECWSEKTRAYNNKHRENDPVYCKERDRRAWLWKKYGMTRDDYFNLLDSQAGCCAICGEFVADTMDVDHCHETGKVRGLLCGPCNSGIGHMRDSIPILEAAIEYLKRSAEQEEHLPAACHLEGDLA